MATLANFLSSLNFKWQLIKARVEGLSWLASLLHKAILVLFIWLIKIENSQRLKKLKYPVIFAFNHNNYFETLLVPCVLFAMLRKPVSFAVHWVFNFMPYVGWAVRQIKPILVYNRKTRFKFLLKHLPARYPAVIDEAKTRLEQGLSVGIFPEGSCNRSPYYLRRGRLGLEKIVSESGVLVIPCGIVFLDQVRRKRIPRWGRLILRFGEAINFAEKANKQRLSRHHITDRVMHEISILCGKKYRPSA